MKLVLAVVQSRDADGCVRALLDTGHECTRLPSFGGFLDRENVTLLTAVTDDDVDGVVDALRARGRRRSESLGTPIVGAETMGALIPPPLDVEVGGATVFVLDVVRLEKL